MAVSCFDLLVYTTKYAAEHFRLQGAGTNIAGVEALGENGHIRPMRRPAGENESV
jgi:hypothetical protein